MNEPTRQAALSPLCTDAEATAADAPLDPYSPGNWRACLGDTRTAEAEEHIWKLADVEIQNMAYLVLSSTFGQPGIFPDEYISILASRSRKDFVTVDEFRKLPWLLAKFHGAEVLKILHDADREHALAKLEEARVDADRVRE